MKKVVTYSDGSSYEGEINDEGARHGKGLLRWSREEYYFGDWRNNKMSGKGVHVADNSVYEGDWLNDLSHGRGVCRFITKEDETDEDLMVSYEGEWKDNLKCGKGLGVFTDGSTYEGEFRDDEINGKGIMRFPCGRIEEGEWKDGCLHGFGIVSFPEDDDADSYVYRKGEWVDDYMHGQGELRWKDGSVWSGQFVNDLRNGPARLVDTTYGYTFEGNYFNDKRSDGVIRWLNGDTWVGRFLAEEGIEESEGVMTFAETGDTLKGRWLDTSMKNGKGEMTKWIKAENREVKGEWVGGSFREKEEGVSLTIVK